ncbi:MAG: hypothetical protein LAT82_04010 [Nanoarchaeota archaeon]|nr:hypothetical protein [Nanoarchaeota archaeon]
MISFLEKNTLFQKLEYKRFFGPPLANCLDGKEDCPKCLLFVTDEKRILKHLLILLYYMKLSIFKN